MKTIHDGLRKKIDEYKKLFGRIHSPEEIHSQDRPNNL